MIKVKLGSRIISVTEKERLAFQTLYDYGWFTFVRVGAEMFGLSPRGMARILGYPDKGIYKK